MLANAAAMHAAVKGGSLVMMARVLELGVDVDELDCVDTIGWPCFGTPLLRAIKTGRTEAVRFLLERGADITKRGHGGETALEMVRREKIVGEIKELVETAVEKEGGENGGEADKYGMGWEIGRVGIE